MIPLSFKRHGFSPTIIWHAIWLYSRFPPLREVKEVLAERGIAARGGTLRSPDGFAPRPLAAETEIMINTRTLTL